MTTHPPRVGGLRKQKDRRVSFTTSMTSPPGKRVRLGFIDFVEGASATNDVEPPPARGCSPRDHPRTQLMLGRNGCVSVSISLGLRTQAKDHTPFVTISLTLCAEPVFLKTSETRGPVMQGRLSDAAAAPRQTGSQGHCRSIWHGAIGRNHRQGEISDYRFTSLQWKRTSARRHKRS
jgi:hypothetical protein